MDAYNLAKRTQKKKITGTEIATIGTLGALASRAPSRTRTTWPTTSESRDVAQD